MCFMAAYAPGVLPDADRLVQGAKLNPHGFGWSVGLDEVHHSMTADTAIQSFLEARYYRPGEPAIFHARYATSSVPRGGPPKDETTAKQDTAGRPVITLANCQPLMLDDGSLLAHNGALFPVRGPLSDTRVFAQDFLPEWDLDSDRDRLELGELLGPNKLFFLRPGKAPVLLGERYGVWRPDGSWESNRDGEGISHTAAGQCGACGTPDPDLPEASMCDDCRLAYELRRDWLEAAR
jgi:hypothetical protein